MLPPAEGSALPRVPRLQLSAWRSGLAEAASIAAVIEVVQRIVSTWRARPATGDSCWHPRQIRSREDIEHWALRLDLRPRHESRDLDLIALTDCIRCAVERMNELGPRRASRSRRAPGHGDGGA